MTSMENEKPEQQSSREAQERITYESLRAEVKRRLGELNDAVTAENIRQVLDQSTARLRELGNCTVEALNKARDAVHRDLASANRSIGPGWDSLTEQTADLFAVWKDRSKVFLGQAALSVGEWLQKAGEKIERTNYHTGEVSYGGTFECTACGQNVVLARSGHLPPCPKCMRTEFRRT